MSFEPKRSLGLWTLTALVAGNMIGSGVFLLPSSLSQIGTISLFAWLLTSLGAIVLALLFARLSRLLPFTGGPYAYTRAAYGEFAGFQIAYNYWIAVAVGNAAIVVAFVGYLSVFWPALNTTHWLSLLVSIVTLWLVTFVNIWSIRQVGHLQVITTVLKLVPLLLLALLGLFFIHRANLANFNVTHHSNWHALSMAATLTVWSFVGFESATVPAGNVIKPEINIGRATILGTLIAASVYILSTLAVMGIVPNNILQHSSSPYAEAANVMIGPYGAYLMAAVAAIACFGTLNGWILMQGQIPYAAAKDGLFPKIFMQVSSHGTPYVGLIISSIIITVLLILRYGASLVDQFTFIILLAVFASLIPYLYCTVAELALLYKNPENVDGKRLTKLVILSLLGFAFTFWAAAGAGAQIIYYGVLLFLSSVPAYIWVRYLQYREQKLIAELDA